MPEQEYYGIGEKPVFEGLSGYRAPFNFELTGKRFHLIMDDSSEYYLDFLSGQSMAWTKIGEAAKYNRYECLKGDELTYFVNIEVEGAKPRTGMTFILDVKQRLVTMVTVKIGENKNYPYLVTVQHCFGAIDVDGKKLPEERHTYTEDMVGRRIYWRYNPSLSIVHVYYDKEYMTVTAPEGFEISIPPEELEKRRQEWEQNPYNEPTMYIKVKEGIYIVCCNETHPAKRGKIGNNLLFLMDLKRMRDVGRSFGLAKDYTPENYMFTARGHWATSDGVLETKSKDNPYLEDDRINKTFTL